MQEIVEGASTMQPPSAGLDNAEEGDFPTSTGTVVPQPSGTTSQLGATSSSDNSENLGSSMRAPRLTWSLGVMAALHLVVGL